MGRRFPDGGLLRYRIWVPQQLGDVNKQGSGDSPPIGAQHGDMAANHTDLQSGCGRTCVFAVQVWSNLWDLIWLRTSHYSMGPINYAKSGEDFRLRVEDLELGQIADSQCSLATCQNCQGSHIFISYFYYSVALKGRVHNRAGWGPKIFLTTLDNQLPSGFHRLKDFLCTGSIKRLVWKYVALRAIKMHQIKF